MFSVQFERKILLYIGFITVFTATLFWLMSCNIQPEDEYPMPTAETPESTLNIQPSPSATTTATNTPIPTASPTLSPIQIAEGIRQIYESNGGCNLPCLWSIELGKTKIQDVQGRIGQLGTFEDFTRPAENFQRVTFTTLAPDDLIGIYDDDSWSLGFRLENDVVVGLSTGIGIIEKFSQPSTTIFLREFGEPEEIWIDVIPDPVGLLDYSIALYYPSKGVFIIWRDTVGSLLSEDDSGIEITICPQHIPTLADTMIGSYPPYFYFFPPNSEIPFDEIAIQHLTLEPSYRLLDDASTNKLYNTYLDPNTQICLPFSYP